MRGGTRPGAGRPKGSKNKLPRPKTTKPEQLIRTRFLEAAKALDDSGELAEKMRFWLNHPNDHIAFQAFQTALAFAVGKPREQAAAGANMPSDEEFAARTAELLEQWARLKRQPSPKALPGARMLGDGERGPAAAASEEATDIRQEPPSAAAPPPLLAEKPRSKERSKKKGTSPGRVLPSDYVCPRFQFLQLGYAKFEAGKLTTKDPEVQAKIQAHDWYGVHIFEAGTEPAQPVAQDAQQEAVRETPRRPLDPSRLLGRLR